MIELFLVGIGAGDVKHLTLQAIDALNGVDLILIPRKGPDKADLAERRRAICRQVVTNPAVRVVEFDLPRRDAQAPDYRRGVLAWHQAIAQIWEQAIRAHLGARGRVALMIWGDPSLYDSSLRIAALMETPNRPRVIPGVTALQMLTAAHAIPLNEIGAPVLISTGRLLRARGWPPGADSIAIMLDGGCAFQSLPPDGIHIWWGAFLGMTEEILLHGPLREVGPDIIARRTEAAARHGWIMDIYLLRRFSDTPMAF